MLNIVICVKQVYDSACFFTSSNKEGTINFQGVPLITNPYDLHAVFWATELKKQLRAVSIQVISLGKPTTEKVLRECMALGANRALLISEPSFEYSDGYGTGIILTKAVSQISHFDLILCGKESIDNNSGFTSAVIADQLNISLITNVTSIDINSIERKAIVKRKIPGGKRQVLKTDVPCLLTVELEISAPQNPSLRSLMAAKKQTIEHYNLGDLGLSKDDVCLHASKLQTTQISVPKPRQKKIFTPSSSLSPLERIRLVMAGGITRSSGKLVESTAEEMASAFIDFVNEKQLIGD